MERRIAQGRSGGRWFRPGFYFRDRLRSNGISLTIHPNQTRARSQTAKFRPATGSVRPASDAQRSVSPMISTAWSRPQCSWAETASGEKHLTRPHCPLLNLGSELGYAAILPISALSPSVRNAQPSRSVSKYRRFPFGRQIIPTDIEFPAGRTTDLESVETLVAHLICPIRFRRSGLIQQ